MKEIFTWLLINLVRCGEIKNASLFDGKFSSVTIATEDGDYNINIVKCQKDQGVKNDN